jgi:hypothetical protein
MASISSISALDVLLTRSSRTVAVIDACHCDGSNAGASGVAEQREQQHRFHAPTLLRA